MQMMNWKECGRNLSLTLASTRFICCLKGKVSEFVRIILVLSFLCE
jgi:hypothetical protein